MARVTVEDCVTEIPNRYDLIMVAAQRVRDIVHGAPLTINRDNDKNSVVSLREIAKQNTENDALRGKIVTRFQKVVIADETDEEEIDFMDGEAEWASVSRKALDDDHAEELESMQIRLAEDIKTSAEDNS